MSASKFCVMLISVVLLCSTFIFLDAKSLTPENRRKINRHCLKVVGIDKKTVGTIVDSELIPRDGKYGDYLVCGYRLQAFLDHSKSELNRDNIAAFLAETYSSDEVAFIMQGCQNVKSDVPRELVLDALDCFTQQIQIVNALRVPGNGNGIDNSNPNPFIQ